jgi:hypothetical protein
MRSWRLILFIFLLTPCIAVRAQILRGRITDSNGAPMPAASVYITELRQGTTSNSEGHYELPIAPGSYTVSYQFLGYVPVIKNFNITEEGITEDITLSEQLFEIPPVRVSASGNDPALFIMRKAIAMAPFHLNEVRMYRAEVYIRGGGSIDRIPELLKKRMKIEANSNDLVEGRYYFSESVNVITFTAPDKYEHRVVSSRSSEEVSQGQASPMDFIEASFYQPVLAELAISPLAPNAFSHYIFTFLGSSSHGDYVIDKIRVTPKRKSQQLFTGDIYIVEDLWALQSLDLTNDNMAGQIRVRQLYTPVESGIWMPVSHEFDVDISIMGIKARAAYTSAVKYLEVVPDMRIPRPQAYAATGDAGAAGDREVTAGPEVTEAGRELERILSRDDLTARDMARLARLNGKNAKEARGKPSLEIEDKTTMIIDEDASRKDSAYWAEVRPIPLTVEEKASLSVSPAAQGQLARRDTSELKVTLGSGSQQRQKSPAGRFIKDIATGRRWQLSPKTTLEFNGLTDLKSFSFNAVDGFIAGSGMSLSSRSGKAGRFTLATSARYAFSRNEVMWNVSANMLYDPMHSGNIFFRTGQQSEEFARSGVNPLVNTVSSLFFRNNIMRLYGSSYLVAGHRGELANGLILEISGMYEERVPLANSSEFSFFRSGRPWAENLPDNPYITGGSEGYEQELPFSHRHLSITPSLSWTPRQKYRLSAGSKINAGSDYPTFTLTWRHGYNYNDTLSGHYDLLAAEVSMTRRSGPLSELRWRVRGGRFFNGENVHLQDMYFFNTQSSPLLLNNYEDAFYLKPCYSVSTRKGYAEGHIRYTTPTLLLKRLPFVSRTLMRENIGLSALWTPESGCYMEAGYSLSEVFLVGTAGIYAGFSGKSFQSAGFRVVLRLE